MRRCASKFRMLATLAKALTIAAVWAAGLAIVSPARAQAPSSDSGSPLDYTDPATWLCRPDRPQHCETDLSTTRIAANGNTSIERYRAAAEPEVDCFYVYPTVSRDPGRLSDLAPGINEEIGFVRHQFSRFGSVCRLFAPLYRQATLASAFGSAGPADRNTVLADVAAAWRDYLARDNRGRGVVLIGHSQGANLLRELVRTRIDGTPDQRLILSAMLIGAPVTVATGRDVGGDFQSMPLCRAADQLGCIIAYASFRSTVRPDPDTYFGTLLAYTAGRDQADGGEDGFVARAAARELNLETVCTNPAALAGGSGALDAYLPTRMYDPPFETQPNPVAQPDWVRGGAAIGTPFVRVPGLLSARCAGNEAARYLEIIVHGDARDARVDDILGDINLGEGPSRAFGLHLIDIHLAMGNLIDIVRRQAAAYRTRAR